MYFPFEAISDSFFQKKKYIFSSPSGPRSLLMPKSLKNADHKDSYKPSYSESMICTLGVYLHSNDDYSLFSSTAEDKPPRPLLYVPINILAWEQNIF